MPLMSTINPNRERMAALSERIKLGRVCCESGYHVDKSGMAELTSIVDTARKDGKDIVVACIGTDRSTGDSLGPLVGSMLEDMGLSNVFGTLDNPIHALNLEDVLSGVYANVDKPFVIAVDAALGKSESIGDIIIKANGLLPGTGVGKNLPLVGDIGIVGVVNVGGFMEYFVLQNTRLSLVMKMAKRITELVACVIGAPIHDEVAV